MVTDRPTASLTGQENWEWNERRQDRTDRDAAAGSGRSRRDAAGGRNRPVHGDDREAALEREIVELEAELDRTERRFQCVVEQYERLLAEKNRELSELRESTRETGSAATYLSTVLWWRED
jgi:hypothetical protein